MVLRLAISMSSSEMDMVLTMGWVGPEGGADGAEGNGEWAPVATTAGGGMVNNKDWSGDSLDSQFGNGVGQRDATPRFPIVSECC